MCQTKSGVISNFRDEEWDEEMKKTFSVQSGVISNLKNERDKEWDEDMKENKFTNLHHRLPWQNKILSRGGGCLRKFTDIRTYIHTYLPTYLHYSRGFL